MNLEKAYKKWQKENKDDVTRTYDRRRRKGALLWRKSKVKQYQVSKNNLECGADKIHEVS